MGASGLQKYFSDVPGLQAHKFFVTTGLLDEVSTGEVFPAIRKNEVHFYFGGARLCVYKAKGKEMYSNNRYLGLPDSGKSRDVPIPAVWCTPAKYREIKKICKERRDAESELSIVSQLFREFSIAASHLPSDTSSKTQDMVDCLFLTPQSALVFVEVKKSSNSEARSKGQREPAVASQLRRYRRQLGSDRLREEINDVYAGVIDTLGEIMKQSLPSSEKTFKPRIVFDTVPLLVVGPPLSLCKNPRRPGSVTCSRLRCRSNPNSSESMGGTRA